MHNRFIITSMLAVLLVAGCKKENPVRLDDGTSVLVTDLEGDVGASMGDGVDGKTQRPFYPLLYNLRTGQHRLIRTREDSVTYFKRADWDIAFMGEYNSFVVVNSATLRGSPGYGGSGKGSLLVVDRPYNQVTEAPSVEEFGQQGLVGAGWDGGNGIGWYFYSLDNHIAVPVRNRTLLLRTADGHYAKLEMLNIYRGNPPVVTDLFWPAPYLTFRYYVQEDGSANLKTN